MRLDHLLSNPLLTKRIGRTLNRAAASSATTRRSSCERLRGAHWLAKIQRLPSLGSLPCRARSSGVEHTLDKRGVGGSKPPGPKFLFDILYLRALSSAGRAPALQAGGRRFDSGRVQDVRTEAIKTDFRSLTTCMDPQRRREGALRGAMTTVERRINAIYENKQASHAHRPIDRAGAMEEYGQATKCVWWMPRR